MTMGYKPVSFINKYQELLIGIYIDILYIYTDTKAGRACLLALSRRRQVLSRDMIHCAITTLVNNTNIITVISLRQ